MVAVPALAFWVLTVAGLALLLVGERRQQMGLVAVGKMLAALSFVAAGAAALPGVLPGTGPGPEHAAHDVTAGRAIFIGLLWCLLGDALLLVRRSSRAFLAGIGAFLVGHVCYAAAFLQAGVDAKGLVAGALFMAALSAFVLRRLRGRLHGVFRVAVPVYIGVIGVMCAAAVGAAARSLPVDVAVGAVLFAASDLTVARERFLQPGFENGAIGLPLYFAAQLVLAQAFVVVL